MMRRKGFTIVELLTVVAIIAVLIGLLVPSLNMVRTIAKKTEQKAMFNAMDQGIIAFKQDYGDYPPSFEQDDNGDNYCGAMTLTEALLGWDLMGFHPESEWEADGEYEDGGDLYQSGGTAYDLDKRKDRHIDIDSVDVHTMDELYPGELSFPTRDCYVICDVFAKQRITTTTGDRKKAGTPVVYYKANTSSNFMDSSNDTAILNSRYNYFANAIIFTQNVYGETYRHDLSASGPYRSDIPGKSGRDLFYSNDTDNPPYQYKIVDEQATEASNVVWPHRPDSYILISAGPDGNFGTDDDITNF
jgi:prepilin-type N-terminal cleavage/methylation domain-containing protein